MRPDDLLGRAHGARHFGIRPLDSRFRIQGGLKLAAADGDDAARLANLFFLLRQQDWVVGFAARLVSELACRRLKAELVTILGVVHRLFALYDVQSEVERVAPENVPEAVATHDDELQSGFIGDALESSRAHLARGADAKAIAGDDKRLAPMDTLAEVRHQVSE